ncbi:GNAT family N-acetyltransferase [Woodsholea maritima]|uniref:GNAT family N-acetyltransferase n=1 Tax=Woodsholea maritima TaxID=240237 RepID=UPI00035DB898|nr:N-acetyltransferase [Woodsholea maritima]
MSVTIRTAREGDYNEIDQLLRAAFPGPQEAQIVRILRAADADSLELVGAHAHGDHEHVLAHILFSPVTAKTAAGVELFGLGLGPLAVDGSVRRQGLGAAMVAAGLEHLKWLPVPFVVVLGSPKYYAQFGFVPASARGWRWDKDRGDDPDLTAAFQVLIRDEDRCPLGSHDAPVTLSYHPAFDMAE